MFHKFLVRLEANYFIDLAPLIQIGNHSQGYGRERCLHVLYATSLAREVYIQDINSFEDL